MQKGSVVQLGICSWELPLGPGPASETRSILYKAAELLARIYNFFTYVKESLEYVFTSTQLL